MGEGGDLQAALAVYQLPGPTRPLTLTPSPHRSQLTPSAIHHQEQDEAQALKPPVNGGHPPCLPAPTPTIAHKRHDVNSSIADLKGLFGRSVRKPRR